MGTPILCHCSADDAAKVPVLGMGCLRHCESKQRWLGGFCHPVGTAGPWPLVERGSGPSGAGEWGGCREGKGSTLVGERVAGADPGGGQTHKGVLSRILSLVSDSKAQCLCLCQQNSLCIRQVPLSRLGLDLGQWDKCPLPLGRHPAACI